MQKVSFPLDIKIRPVDDAVFDGFSFNCCAASKVRQQYWYPGKNARMPIKERGKMSDIANLTTHPRGAVDKRREMGKVSETGARERI